jgi:hypothetical protein
MGGIGAFACVRGRDDQFKLAGVPLNERFEIKENSRNLQSFDLLACGSN